MVTKNAISWNDLYAAGSKPHVRLAAFQEAFEDQPEYLHVAICASFFPVLTFDLLAKAAQNFPFPEAAYRQKITTIAADILISTLCEPLGQGMYEMYEQPKQILFKCLELHENYGALFADRLALFLDKYRLECAPAIPTLALAEAFRITALFRINLPQAAREFLNAYDEGSKNRVMEMRKLANEVTSDGDQPSSPANPLRVAMRLIRGIELFHEGDREDGIRILESLEQHLTSNQIPEGIRTRIPEEVWQYLRKDEEPIEVERKVLPVIINKIAGDLGISLSEEKDLEKLMRFESRNTYALNERGAVIGLNLCNNNLTGRSIAFVSDLDDLQALNLSDNQLSSFAVSKEMKKLRYLNLVNNESLKEIKFGEGIKTLERLECRNCSLKTIFFPAGFEKLERIDCRRNGLKTIRFSGFFPSLRELDLRENDLQEFELPRSAINLEVLDLFQNPNLENPPEEIIQLGSNAIIKYLKDLESQGEREIFEIKMLIVGEGETGKTTLFNLLQDRDSPMPDHRQKSTPGIQIQEGWQFPHIDRPNTDFLVDIWDFGGQEILYMTHQFFLTPRSFYVLLADGRRQAANFSYWLQIIDLLGRGSSDEPIPVLVILNEKGNPISKLPYDPVSVKKDFPNLNIIRRDVDFSVKDDGRIDALIQTIKEILCRQIDHLPLKISASWDNVRQRLHYAKLNRNYIRQADFSSFCINEGIREQQQQADLARLLHDLGTIIYFQEDINLADFIILDPSWALKAIYALFRDQEIINRRGGFDKALLQRVWTERGYSLSEQAKLLNLLLKDNLGICFRTIEGQKEVYIAPQLLPEFGPPEIDWKKTPETLRFIYHYPFMPKGLIGRLMVRLNDQIKIIKDRYAVWEYGMIISKNGCRAKIEIVDDKNQGRQILKIEIQGKSTNERKHLLQFIRSEIDGIHRHSFPSLRVFQKVPCNCSECNNSFEPYEHDFDQLQAMVSKLGAEVKSQCGKSFEEVPVKKLLEGITPRKTTDRPINIYISQSVKDEKYLRQFLSSLSALHREGKITSWYDASPPRGTILADVRKEQINTADIILILVSPDYLREPYLSKVEVKEIMEREKQGSARVIPIYIRDTHVGDSPFGHLAGLPRKGRAISSFPNQEEAWNQVVEEIEKVLDQPIPAVLINVQQHSLTEMLTGGFTFEMISVEGGFYLMGNTDEMGLDFALPVHKVGINRFYIGKYPVTQQLWEEVMGPKNNPSYTKGEHRPVDQVSWVETKNFLRKLNEKTGRNYRLLTEAEWEYAARGGKEARGYTYAGSNQLKEVGWYIDNANGESKPVGLKNPNELGIYDMSGNVLEWVEDQWHSNYEHAPNDGSAWVDLEMDANRVFRGGNSLSPALLCRVAYRDSNKPSFRSEFIGFRLGLSLQSVS